MVGIYEKIKTFLFISRNILIFNLFVVFNLKKPTLFEFAWVFHDRVVTVSSWVIAWRTNIHIRINYRSYPERELPSTIITSFLTPSPSQSASTHRFHTSKLQLEQQSVDIPSRPTLIPNRHSPFDIRHSAFVIADLHFIHYVTLFLFHVKMFYLNDFTTNAALFCIIYCCYIRYF